MAPVVNIIDLFFILPVIYSILMLLNRQYFLISYKAVATIFLIFSAVLFGIVYFHLNQRYPGLSIARLAVFLLYPILIWMLLDRLLHRPGLKDSFIGILVSIFYGISTWMFSPILAFFVVFPV